MSSHPLKNVIAIYIESQHGEFTQQGLNIFTYIQRFDWDGYILYEDMLGITGSRRPEFARILFDAEASSIHRIVVWNTEGLFSNNEEFEKVMLQLQECGVDLISIQDEFELKCA